LPSTEEFKEFVIRDCPLSFDVVRADTFVCAVRLISVFVWNVRAMSGILNNDAITTAGP
jgi:hypothetical protein